MSDTFSIRADIPRITHAQIKDINELAKPECFSQFRSKYRTWLERVGLRHVSPSELMCLQAIVARTFSWKKIIEVVPLSVFKDGMRDDMGQGLKIGTDQIPYFSGTGLNYKTINNAVEGLSSLGLLTQFGTRTAGREGYSFMPFSTNVLIKYVNHFEVECDVETVHLINGLPEFPARSQAEEALLSLFHRD